MTRCRGKKRKIKKPDRSISLTQYLRLTTRRVGDMAPDKKSLNFPIRFKEAL
jgi:hypothetical protein